MNDEINKLLREKTHWEARIVELGGPDYNVIDNGIVIINLFSSLETWSKND